MVQHPARTSSFLAASAVLVTAMATMASRAARCQTGLPEVPAAALQTSNVLGMFARTDGTFGADGRHYVASFDELGATLRIAHPGDRDQLVALTLRLRDWRRSEQPPQIAATAADGPTVRRASRDVVHYEHGGVTERYLVTARGFEQSFVLHTRPAGTGDFVLGIAASSQTLRAPARQPAQQSLEFHADGLPAIGYGEAVAFSRGHGGMDSTPVPVATRYDGEGNIELVVPAAFIDSASYPVIIDPAVGPVQSPGGSGWVDANPDVAYDPQEDLFLCVWERSLSTNTRVIRAARYRRDGTPYGSLMFINSLGFNTRPTVGYLGTSSPAFSGFYIVWSGSTGLQGQRVASLSGASVGGVQQITTVSPATRDSRPALSIRGNILVVAWDRTPSGAPHPTQILARRVELDPLPATTATMTTERVLDTATTGYVQRVRVPRSFIHNAGAEVRLCWERFFTNPAPGDFDVRTAVLSFTPVLTGSLEATRGLPGASSIGTDERRPDLAQINTVPTMEGLIAFEAETDIRGQLYSQAGLLGSPFDIRATSAIETEPAVGAGSTEYSVGYLSAPFSNGFASDVYAASLDTIGNVLAVDQPIHQLSGPLQRSLRATSVSDMAGVAIEPNGVMFGWQLESDSIGLIEDIRARLFEPVEGTATPFGLACPGPGGTLPMIDVVGSPFPGNQQFAVQVSNAPPNSLVALIIGNQLTTLPIPGAPGCQLYMGLPLIVALPTVTSAAGVGEVDLPIPVGAPPGAVLATQWGVYTPGWNAFGWITSSDIDLAWQQ